MSGSSGSPVRQQSPKNQSRSGQLPELERLSIQDEGQSNTDIYVPDVNVDPQYIKYTRAQRQRLSKTVPLSNYGAYDPSLVHGKPIQYGRMGSNGMEYPPDAALTDEQLPAYYAQHPNERLLPKDSSGRTAVYGTYEGAAIHGPANWDQYYSEWNDIGDQYREVAPARQPLPAEELEFCQMHGIKFEKELGRGSFGQVWLVTVPAQFDPEGSMTEGEVRESRQLACKILSLKTYSIQNFRQQSLADAVKELADEVDLHRSLSHRNIVKCEYMFTVHDQISGFPYTRLLIFMELCEGDLNDLIEDSPEQKLTENEAMKMLNDMSTGLKYLHDHNIVHLDIKPKNLFYINEGEGRTYKLGDFGLSQKFAENIVPHILLERKVGTKNYMAPEVAANPQNYIAAKPADIYSMGCVFTEALVGKQKWIECIEALHNNRGHEQQITTNFGLSPLCGHIITLTTNETIGSRPTIEQMRMLFDRK